MTVPFQVIEHGTQSTLKEPVTLEGGAFFEAKPAEVTLYPAAPDTGVIFDVEDGGVFPARADYLCGNSKFQNTTVLGENDTKVITPEHLLSSIRGLGISNIRVNVSGNGHLPSLDGSSFDYCDKMLSAGIVKQDEKRYKLDFTSDMKVASDDRVIHFTPSDGIETSIEAKIVYDEPIGQQSIIYEHGTTSYCLRISWARTFAYNPFRDESVLDDKLPGFWIKDDHFVDSNMIAYTEEEYVTHIRRADEPVRHKVLDFIGDLSLCGMPIISDIYLYKPGHSLNQVAAKKILSQIRNKYGYSL